MPLPRRSSALTLTAALLLAAVAPLLAPLPPTVPGRPASVPSQGGPAANLTGAVDPATWWMGSGENATFGATWVNVPAGCQLLPIWYRWSFATGGAEGVLGATNGSSATFYAAAAGSGTTTLSVALAASLRCGGNVSSAFAQAEAVVTVGAPISITGLGVEPDPLAPGEPATLVGEVSGGDPPYLLRVAWGDGNVSNTSVGAAGPLSLPYVYGHPGTFAPSVLVTDAEGRTATGVVSEAAYVSDGFAVALSASTTVAEVGEPVLFAVETVAAPANFSSVFACTNAGPTGNESPNGLVFGCAFAGPGTSEVSFEAVGASLPFPIVSAVLAETVVAPPSIVVPGPPPYGEVGRTTYAPLLLAGGVPPLAVHWSLVGTDTAGEQTVPSDGLDYLPLLAEQPGTLLLAMTVVDRLGVSSATASEEVPFAPGLAVVASAAGGTRNGSVYLNVSASVVAGAPPFDWSVVPGSAAANGTPVAGALGAAGGFGWNATFRREGTETVGVVVVDADGAFRVLNVTVELVPSLTVSASVRVGADGALLLSATIAGGVGPFGYRWNDSAGESWNGTASSDGPVRLGASTAAHGALSFSLVVTDALGASANATATASVPPAALLAGGGSTAPVLAVVAAVALAAAATALLLRRRRAPVPPPPPDPVTVLREVIEPSDGVDRGMVEMLAEEQGLSREVTRATLERLKAEGTVRSGPGNDGEEVLAWSEPLR